MINGCVQPYSGGTTQGIPRFKCNCWMESQFKRVTKTQQSGKRAKTNKPKLLLGTWVVWQILKATVALRRFVPMKELTVWTAALSGPSLKEGGLPTSWILPTPADQTAFSTE